MSRIVTFQGKPLTLIGRQISLGQKAFNFKVVSPELKETQLSDFNEKIKVINFFPSLDTPVCDLQVKEFNRQAAGLSSQVVVMGISMDLPFAQSRFCSQNEIKNEVVFSDYRYNSFGLHYGFLIKELKLLCRGSIIIDQDNVIRYLQVVKEITQAVNFAEVFNKLQEVLLKPSLPRLSFLNQVKNVFRV